jgi:L-asparaginase/Glu-tRNA(Gln) amidotransferase subunit D
VLLMFKILFGILMGVVIVTYYPNISEVAADLFVESGARDVIIEKLEEVN